MKNKQLLIVLCVLVIVASLLSVVACDVVATDEVKIVITNKAQLTAAWTEGEADRQLAVEITVGDAVDATKAYTVSSSDTNVVSVADDNKTLKAVGGGKATITVKADDVTDSVEINVTPSLKAVKITNKTALTAIWTVGDDARTLAIEFNPDYYQTNKPEYTVVSSDPTVVEVGADKATLTAKKLGEATITVTAGKFSDSVKLSVRPALESVQITNKEDLSAVWTDWSQKRTIALSFAPSEYYTADNTTATVTCNPDNAITVDGYTLTAAQTGSVTVTVSVAGQSDSFTVDIQRSVPQIAFEDTSGFTETAEGGNMNAIADVSVTLPVFTARACDGKAVTVVVTVPDGVQYDEQENSVIAPQGSYELTLTATDPVDETKVTTKKITVWFTRKLIEWNDGSWDVTEQYVADNEQKLATSMDGFQRMQFNAELSDYYYAEATFYTADYAVAGIANYVAESVDGDRARELISIVATSGNADYKIIDFDTNAGWDVQENTGANTVLYQYRLTEYGGLKALEKQDEMYVTKMSVLRLGTVFYMFYNDQYVAATDMDYYASQNTTPGLFVCGYSSDDYVSQINYFSDKEAVTNKYNELTLNGKSFIRPFVTGNDYAKSKNGFTANEKSTERGINFDYTDYTKGINSGCVSTYMFFEGDFTFSWEYKATSAWNKKNIKFQMYVEMLSLIEYRNTACGGIQLGADYDVNSQITKYMLNATGMAENPTKEEAPNVVSAEYATRFTISRKLCDGYALITLTATQLDGSDYTVTREIKIGATAENSTDGQTAFEDWNKPVVLIWRNFHIAGEYSNIMWKDGNDNWVK